MNAEMIRQHERRHEFVEAAALYEGYLEQNREDITAILNLAILYWYATDTGILSAHHLSVSFVNNASSRCRELLDFAASSLNTYEAKFWRLYIDHIDYGNHIENEVNALLASGNCQIALLYKVLTGSISPDDQRVRTLLEGFKEGESIKTEYILSILRR